MADIIFPDDISKWAKGRIREKDSDSSHYDDFYRYGNFGIEHDANGTWEAYTIVDEKPILARDGFGSFDEAVEFFKDEMRHKALKDSESHGESEDCKITDESPEPPSYPEEESSGMRLEIFLKSAEDMLSEYQGFTKASNVKVGQYYAHGDAYRQAQRALADAYRKQFSNVKGIDLKALSNVLDSFGSEDEGGDIGAQKRSNRLQTLRYMDDAYPEPAKWYRYLRNNLSDSRIPKGEMTNARPYRFLDDDDLKAIRAKYGDSKDKWIQKMSSRDFDLDDISDKNTLNYVNNLMAGGFNVNRGRQYDGGRSKDYLYEQYPSISEFLPEVVDGKLTGLPVNPFTAVKYRTPRIQESLTDEEKAKIEEDARNRATHKYKNGEEEKVPVRYAEKLDENSKKNRGKRKSISYLKKINDAGDTDVLFTINPMKFAYHAPVNDMIVNRGADPTHTSMYAKPWVRAEEYGEKTDDVNENVKRMVQDPEIHSLLKAYYTIKGNVGKHKASIASVKEDLDKEMERLKETPVEDDIEKKYDLAKKMVDDWEYHFDKYPEDKNDARQNKAYEKAKAELKPIEYRRNIKHAYDAAKKAYDDRTYASKANDKLLDNVYRELYRKSNEFLKRTAPMKVWYDIMANGAQYADEAGITHVLPIKYIPPNMSELSFKGVIRNGEGKGTELDEAHDPYAGVKNYTIPFSQLPDRDDVIDALMQDSADYIVEHPVEPEPESKPKVDSRKQGGAKDSEYIKKLSEEYIKQAQENMKADKKPKNPEPETEVKVEEKVVEEKPKTEKPKTEKKKSTKKGAEMKAEKTEEKTEKPKTEKTEKSATAERSAEDIFNEWSSGETHLIRDPWKTLVLDAGAKESDPLKIHDDSGNILFDLRHQ